MPEDQNITPPSPEPTPQQRIDIAASDRYKRSGNTPVPPIPPFRIDPGISLSNRLINAAENIALTNSRILTNLDQMKTMFSRFSTDQKGVDQIKKEVQTGKVASIDPHALTDSQRIRALSQAEKLRGLPFEEQAKGLQAIGFGKLEDGTLKVGEEQYAGDQLQQALDRITGRAKKPGTPDIEKLASGAEQGMMDWSQQQKDTLAERLQARGLRVWDFANPAHTLRNVTGMMTGHHVPHLPGSPKIPTTVPGNVTSEGVGAGEAGGLRSAAGPLERLMAAAGGGGIAAKIGLGLIPGIGEAALGLYALTQVGQHIPGVRSLLRARQGIINLDTTGALTGEGRGAGIAAFREARDLRGGIIGSQFHGLLHPFDPITSQIATEIVTSVRTQGFTGKQGRAFEQATASLYRDLRLPIDQTTQLLTDAVRQGGESLGQIAKEMHTFDDAAHSLQMNINEYATSVAAAAKTLRDVGAGASATQFAQSLLQGLPRAMRTPEGVGVYQQNLAGIAPFITGRTGVLPWNQQTGPNLAATRAAAEQVMKQQFAMARGATFQEKANFAATFLPAFQGMTPLQVNQMMTRMNQGRGPGSVAALDVARHEYSKAVTGMASKEMMRGSDIIARGHDWARQQGISEAEWNRISAASRSGKRWGDIREYQVSGMIDTSTINMSQLKALRERTIEGLKGTLTDPQRQELEKHIGDRHWSFDKAIQRYESGRGRFGSGSSVDVNGVTITLKGKAAKLLDLNAPNKQAVATGRMPANQQYYDENSRLNPGW